MIDTLVFSSGGVSGISFIGCLQALEECGELESVKTIIGSSAGSIMALLIVLSYTSEEIIQIIRNINFSSLFHTNLSDLENIDQMLGLSHGTRLQSVIDLFIQHKLGNDKKHITFSELYEKTKIKLIISTVCLTTKNIEFFSVENSPDMEVRIAIKMSSCIPVLFSPVQWEEKLYVDGGLLGKYPIDIINDSQCGIGFFIKFEEDTSYKETNGKAQPETFISYITKLLNIVYNSSQQLHSYHPNIHTVELFPNLSWYDPFDISEEQKDMVIKHGKVQTKQKIIELRMNLYNRITSAHKKIEDCIKKKSLMSRFIIRNL